MKYVSYLSNVIMTVIAIYNAMLQSQLFMAHMSSLIYIGHCHVDYIVKIHPSDIFINRFKGS